MKKINKTIIFFDCDNTIWYSKDNDYIGSCKSEVCINNRGILMRKADKKKFYLIKKTSKLIKSLSDTHLFDIGIVSDNPKKIVIESLKAFNIYNHINPLFINVRLWKGYCPKDQMIQEILKQNFPSSKQNFVLIDDKDYKKAINSIGGHFIRINRNATYKILLHRINKLFCLTNNMLY